MPGRLVQVIFLFLSALTLLFLDFATKAACFYLLPFPLLGRGGMVIVENFLGIQASLNLAFNRGAAWGLFANMQIPLLIARIVVILGMLGYLFFKEHRRAVEWPLMLIIVGAIGNVIDFFVYGYVVDFIQLNLWGYHFPLFNLADTLISIGVIWLFCLTFFKGKPRARSQMDQTTRSSLSK